MNKTKALPYGRRFSAVFVAFAMLTVCLFAGMPAKRVSAAGLSASATVSNGKMEAGSNFGISVFFSDDTYGISDAPTAITVDVTGTGGLKEKAPIKLTASSIKVKTETSSGGASTSTLTYSILIEPNTMNYDGIGYAGLLLKPSYTLPGGTTETPTGIGAEVSVEKAPVDGGGGDYVPPVTPEPVGNQIIVKPGSAIPEMNAGETKTLTIPLVASGNRIPGKTQITVDPLPEKLFLNSTSPMQEVNITRTGGNLKLSIGTDSAIASGIYSIGLTAVYKGNGKAVTEKFSVNVKVHGKETSTDGKLSVSSYTLDKDVIKAGENFKLNLTLKNTSANAIKNVDMKLDGLSAEGITVNGGLDTQIINSIGAGSTMTVTYHLNAAKKMTSGNQILTVALGSGETATTSKVFVPVLGTDKKDDTEGVAPSKPLIVIDGYDFGGTSVTGGQTFNLTMSMKNTSTTNAIENLKMTISAVSDADTGGVFTPANSSNTFFIPKVASGASFSQSIDLLTKADAKPKSYGLQISFTYEAVLDDKRESIEASETITIPVSQPDRFEVQDPSVYSPMMFGDTISPYIPYVNKGKSTIFNLSVKIEGENFTTAESTAYIGNVESGSSDSFQPQLNPVEPGKVNAKLTFSYEDANGDVKEIIKEFEVEIQEMQMPEPMPNPDMPIEGDPTGKGLSMWVWVAIAGGGVVILVVAAVIVVKVIKKKKAKKLDDDDEYDDVPNVNGDK